MDEREARAVARWRAADTVVNRALTALVIRVSKLVMRRLNRLEVTGLEVFQSLRSRAGRGLLTFSNHVSYFDDPLLIANLGIEHYPEVRWVAADALNFFGDPFAAFIYSGGKCVPVVRGSGTDQPGLDFLAERLAAGDWVHLFPEGGRTREVDARLSHPFKPGLGRLIAEARPMALPFYHFGMHRVLPPGSKRLGVRHTVRLAFGEPVDCDHEFIASMAERVDAIGGPELWGAIAEWGYDVLSALERRLHPLA